MFGIKSKGFLSVCLWLLMTLPVTAQVTADFSGTPLSGCSPLVVQFTDLSTGPVNAWSWNFGNGNTSTLQNPAAVYVTPGTYTVTLTVSDGTNNNTLTRTSYITVFQNPTANFTNASPTNGCAPHTVCFTDLSTPGDGAINGWLWDFGDGNTSTAQNPCHTFALPGSYNITLVATDVNGCNNTFIINNFVNVSNPPSAAFTGNPLSACTPPLTVNFTNNSSGGQAPLSYQWDFGDGNTSTQQAPSNTYTATGAYNVTLIATDANGCADTVVLNAYVNISDVTANFTQNTTTICAGQSVSFTDQSIGANQWNWDFGDGGTSTQQNPTYPYAAPGTYTVTLIATNGTLCPDTLIQTNLITVNPAPTANFVADTTTSCEVPFTVNFTDLSTGTPVSWAWDFGDGNTSAAQNPTHIYTTPGSYNVTLTVTDAQGCTGTVVFNNYIVIQPPIADFVGVPINGCVPLLVNFTDQSTSVEPIVSWQWDFGDGNTSTAQNPANTYVTTGAFTVTLIIINSAGCTDTLVRPLYIQVGDVPEACFTWTPAQACVNDPITFTDCSINATSWFWQFGDGGTSNAQNPTYAYQDTGCFTVTLTVANFGCTDDTVITNAVCISPPLAQFALNPAQGCAIPHAVAFTDQSILPDTWLWDFGDGNTSTVQNPIHNYLTAGTFNVVLTVTDTISGCTDDANATVTVSVPIADFSGAPLFGCGPLLVNFTDASTANLSPITTWAWDFGDGNTSNQQNPTHTYQTPGIYTVTLTITDANGCTDTRTRISYVQVIGPDVNFGADTLIGCDSLLVNFTDSTIFGAPITSWTWDFGDGGNSNLQNPSHFYAAPGTYTVSLTVTDIDGCSRTFTRNNYIFINSVMAGFAVDDTLGCSGGTFNFTNNSTGTGLNYLWDFGDGNTSTATNPSHTYTINGTYTVTLFVFDNNNLCQDTIIQPNLIDIQDVIADFGAVPTNASCPPLLVSFSDSSFWDIVTWEWDFGDGTGSTLQNPGHVYTQAGSYDVSLIVVNNDGCTDTLLLPGLVNIQGPNGNFTFAPDTGCTPQLVNFNATATNTATYTWDFGDGNVAITTVDSVDHIYTQTGTFFPILILDDGIGCTYSIISPDSIVIDTIPLIDWSVATNVICGIDTAYFTDLTVSTRPIVSWFWDFGDGNTSTLQNPAHLYAGPGSYTVTLAVTNSLGCTDTLSRPAEIEILEPPIAAFNPSDTIGCVPLLVNFTDQSTGNQPITGWDWTFGTGASSIVQNPSANFGFVGVFTTQLVVTDSAGCQDSISQNITIHPGPTAFFTADNPIGCPPHPVVFTANTGMGIVQFDWDFGDGNTGTGNPVNHTYLTSGNFTVTLTVTDTLGCMDVFVRNQYININPPTANFTQTNTSGCPPLAVTFTDNSTGTNTIVNWAWDFGDGNTGLGTPVSHTYQTPGIYSVTLIITDNQGCMDTLVKPNLVTVFEPPVAGFEIVDTLNCVPFTIELGDTSTSANSTVVAWAWDFGDGNTSAVQNPIHPYQNPGPYTITLIVTDANGCMDTVSAPFVAPPPPAATFTATDSIGCIPLVTTFTGGTAGGIVFWEWDFGDGSPAAFGNPITHTYTANGSFTVTLIVEDSIGCRDTLSKPQYININPPVADFTQNVTSGCPPLSVTFSDNSNNIYPIVNWDWDFGDGNTGSGAPVTHVYATPGIYTVTLIITDSIGCMDTIVKPNLITVFEPPLANFGILDTIACDPFTIELGDSSTSANSTVVGWNWDFGDGGTSILQNPIHGYQNPGPYIITLIATDANGCMDTASIPFEVPVRPAANFIGLDSVGCLPHDVLFIADSIDIVSYSWTFGDGNSSTVGPQVSHLYPNRGSYSVTLIIEDIYGCFDTLTKPNYIFIDSLDADFIFDQTVGCPPTVVNFTDQSYSDTTIVSWQWNFGDGSQQFVQNPSHTYITPGSYTVTLIVTNAIGCIDTIALPTIEIFDNLPPAVPPILRATVLSNTSDSIAWRSFTEPDFSHYVLYWEVPTGSNVWQPVDSFFNIQDTFYVHNGLSTLNNVYCYRLQVVDICGQRSSLDSSRRHCTINLEASPGIDEAILNWSAYIGWDSVEAYDVFRVQNYDPAQTFYIGSVPGGVYTYIDSAVVCYEDYCYRIRAREFGGFMQQSWSDTSCALPIHIPAPLPINICSATILNDSFVELTWLSTAGYDIVNIFLEKSFDGVDFQQLAILSPNQNSYIDTDVQVDQRSYWYRMYYIDSCGDVSPLSNVGRTILLDAELISSSPNLDWNPYEEWDAGVLNYRIEVLNDLTQAWQYVDITSGLVTDYIDLITDLDQPIYCYRVFAEEDGGGCRSLSNTVCLPVGPLLFAPNAFSPNGDGLNDFFELKGIYLAEYNLKIFDRWGSLIFESNSLENHWDGFWRGKPCQEGVYVWIASGRGYDGTVIEKRGTATLIR